MYSIEYDAARVYRMSRKGVRLGGRESVAFDGDICGSLVEVAGHGFICILKGNV